MEVLLLHAEGKRILAFAVGEVSGWHDVTCAEALVVHGCLGLVVLLQGLLLLLVNCVLLHVVVVVMKLVTLVQVGLWYRAVLTLSLI